jgi:hypothetical protein
VEGFVMKQKDRDRVIEFLAMPIFIQMLMYHLEEENSPVFNFKGLTYHDKMVIYLKKVSHYMDLIIENRNLDKLVKNIINAHYEDDRTKEETQNSDDMYALAAACYYSQKDFSNKKQYGDTIEPIIREMKRSINKI